MTQLKLPSSKLAFTPNEVINFVAKSLQLNAHQVSARIMSRGSLTSISFVEADTLIVKDNGQLVAVSVSKNDHNRFEVTSRNMFKAGTAIAIQEPTELGLRTKRPGTKSLAEILGIE